MAKKQDKKTTTKKRGISPIFDFYGLTEEKQIKVLEGMEYIKPKTDLFIENRKSEYPKMITRIIAERRMDKFRELVERERVG